MSRDLSSAYSYLTIAEVYREAGQLEGALMWAKFSERPFLETYHPAPLTS